MAKTFDILSGEYLDCIAHLRGAFTARSDATVEIYVAGTVGGKPKSVDLTFRTSDQYLVAIGTRQLNALAKEESYTRMASIRAFTNSHIDGALELRAENALGDQAQNLRSMIFMTSEAARFIPFSEAINQLIAARGTGFPAINYREALFFMNNFDQIRRFGAPAPPTRFKPLTAANMHNFLFLDALQRGARDLKIPFEDTQTRLGLTSIRDIRRG